MKRILWVFLAISVLAAGVVLASTFRDQRNKFREEIDLKVADQMDKAGLYSSVTFKNEKAWDFKVSPDEKTKIKANLKSYFNTSDDQLLEKMVTEVNRDDVAQLGVDWSGLGGTGVPFGIGETEPNKVPDIGSNILGLPAQGLQVGKIQRTALQWTGAITALESKHRARVLSNPSVTTLDGRQTSLHTGETIYFKSMESQTATGTLSSVSTVDAGVRLVVNPRINRDGEITLTISPSVSTATLSGATLLPVVNERAVVTTVRVKSGETAVLAGLVTDTEDVTVRKVPFLSEIPLIGELFKSRTKLPAHTEILIFVTPTIIEN